MAIYSQNCSVRARTNKTKKYICGHIGPASWDLILCGVLCSLEDDLVPEPNKCGQCNLDRLIPQLTHCSECGVAIRPNQDCIEYESRLYCLSNYCSLGSMLGVTGIWDGGKFIDGGVVSTIKIGRRRVKKGK